MASKIRWFLSLVMVLFVGCQSPVKSEQDAQLSTNASRGANSIGLLLHYYFGMFGDGQPTWRGMCYSSQNLSIIAHLPTKSEFFISVAKTPENGNNITNNLRAIISKIRDRAGATEVKENWVEITQHIDKNKQGTRLEEFNYLRSEFIGPRVETDRYSKTDKVMTVVYVACLTPEKPASKALYSVAVAMIPIEVSKEERERLLEVLGDFLREKITYSL